MTAVSVPRRLNAADMTLVVIFLLGIYTHYTIHISATVPFPSAPSGIAGMALLWRRRDQITMPHVALFFVVVLIYVTSICAATDLSFLHKRFTGLIQITYSFVICYAFFITLVNAERRQIAALFLVFSVLILVGCLAEDYGGLRPISNAVRLKLYSSGIYNADARDLLLYGRIRPKLFASEPAAVTFAYTLFTFAWMVISRWRWKIAGYLALMGGGLFAMPGPTLLLMILLLIPYQLTLAKPPGAGAVYFGAVILLSAALVGAFFFLGHSVYGTRLKEISEGDDPSFFYRVIGPALVARDVIRHYPLAGAGLTGERFIAGNIINTFMRSPDFYVGWKFTNLHEVLTNYVWLNWIYLGLLFGTAALAALTVWLKVLGVPSVLFCWMVWVIMGQAAGAYVGPATWTVLFLAGACAVLNRREVPIALRSRIFYPPALQLRTAYPSIVRTPRGVISWRKNGF